MSVTPLVSILIPAYNAESWIADTLESAVRQSWPRKEIIVVDDESSDGTVAVAQQFASRGVVVAKQKNQGAAAARNHAFSLCKGDYVQWLDADDLLEPDKISRQIRALGSQPDRKKLLSSAWGRFMYRPRRAEFVPSVLWADLSPLEWLLRKIETSAYMQTATWLVSRELTEAAGHWDTRMLGDDDGEYFCRVLLASSGVRFVPDAKVFYRMAGPNSLSYLGRSNRKMDALFLSLELHMQYLRRLEDSERVRAACVGCLQRLLIEFYPHRPDIVERASQLAVEFGGILRPPRLSWKYSWLKAAFGWNLALGVRASVQELRWSVVRSWDKMLFDIERRTA
jgi:glycosyltransferase involved in cell wall biosynthesis